MPPRLLCSFFIAASIAAAQPDSGSPWFTTSGGFCADGIYITGWRVDRGLPPGSYVWGSFCGTGDASQGRIDSTEFLAPPQLGLYLIGYPGEPGRRIVLTGVES